MFSINVAIIVLWSVFQFGFGFVFAVKRLVTNVSGKHSLITDSPMAPCHGTKYKGFEILAMVSSIRRKKRAAN